MGNGARRMLGWAVGDSPVRGARGRPARASGVPVMGRVLVELVLGDGLGSLAVRSSGVGQALHSSAAASGPDAAEGA